MIRKLDNKETPGFSVLVSSRTYPLVPPRTPRTPRNECDRDRNRECDRDRECDRGRESGKRSRWRKSGKSDANRKSPFRDPTPRKAADAER
jgi:hypothetical protein